MFGRRRRRSPQSHALEQHAPELLPAGHPVVSLDEEQLFALIRTRLDAFMGSEGTWTLVRRGADDTDSIFLDMASFSLARELTGAIVGERVAATSVAVQNAAAEASVAADRSAERDRIERIEHELTTIAVWADPQRHDPSHLSRELIDPPVRATSDIRAS